MSGHLDSDRFVGCIPGKYANRIAWRRFVLDGVVHRVPTSEPRAALHGAPVAFTRGRRDGAVAGLWARPPIPRLLVSPGDSVECTEVSLVGVGEGVEVFLGGLDLGVAESVHHALEVGAAGQEPGGVGVAEVVDADVEVDAAGFDGREPDVGAEAVAGDRRADLVVKSRSSRPICAVLMRSAMASSQSWRTPKVRDSLSLGYGLGMNRWPVGECVLEISMIVSATVSVRRRKSMWRGRSAISSPQRIPDAISRDQPTMTANTQPTAESFRFYY